MSVLIWMHFSWWFQMWQLKFQNVDFFFKVCESFAFFLYTWSNQSTHLFLSYLLYRFLPQLAHQALNTVLTDNEIGSRVDPTEVDSATAEMEAALTCECINYPPPTFPHHYPQHERHRQGMFEKISLISAYWCQHISFELASFYFMCFTMSNYWQNWKFAPQLPK